MLEDYSWGRLGCHKESEAGLLTSFLCKRLREGTRRSCAFFDARFVGQACESVVGRENPETVDGLKVIAFMHQLLQDIGREAQ
jgi:hypothetical protein